MILSQFSSLRYIFAERVDKNISVTFVMDDPDAITRAAGSFITDGYLAGMDVDVSGAPDPENNGRRRIALVEALRLTLGTANTHVDGGPFTCRLDACFRDIDSQPRWPLANVRAGSFDDGLGPSNLVASLKLGIFPIYGLSINSQALDSVSGVDEYDWYLSQRTDDTSKQFWAVTPAPQAGTGLSRSGSIQLALTAFGASELGVDISPPLYALTAEQRLMALKNLHCYVQRRSDKAIQWFDLDRIARSYLQ